jgi:hypothetical protein
MQWRLRNLQRKRRISQEMGHHWGGKSKVLRPVGWRRRCVPHGVSWLRCGVAYSTSYAPCGCAEWANENESNSFPGQLKIFRSAWSSTCAVYYQQFAERQQNDSMPEMATIALRFSRIPCFSRRDSAVVYTRSKLWYHSRHSACHRKRS